MLTDPLRRVPPQNHPLYNPSSCHIFQHDLTLPLSSLSEKLASPPPEFGDPILPGSFDIVSCVFVLSALPPHKQAGAIQTLVSVRRFPVLSLSLSVFVSSDLDPWMLTRSLIPLSGVTASRPGRLAPLSRLCPPRCRPTAVPFAPFRLLCDRTFAPLASKDWTSSCG